MVVEKMIVIGLVWALMAALNSVQGQSNSVQQQLQLEQFSRQFKPYMDNIHRKNSLDYKENCDYSLEQGRQKQGKELLNMMSSIDVNNFDLNRFQNRMIEILTSINNLNGDLCKGHENLQCNSKGFCDCAESDESLGFMVSFAREGNACRLKGGSICAPQELIEQSRNSNPILQGSPKHELQCSSNNNCIVKSNREACTTATMKSEIERMAKEQGHIDNLIAFILQKTKNGICVCKGATVMASNFLVSATVVFFLAKWYF